MDCQEPWARLSLRCWPPSAAAAGAVFIEALETKAFTNGKDDRPLVRRLYSDAFTEELRTARYLNFGGSASGGEWNDAEAMQLAKVLESGACPVVEVINLKANVIGLAGTSALARAIRSRKAPRVREILSARGDFRSGRSELDSALGGLQTWREKNDQSYSPASQGRLLMDEFA